MELVEKLETRWYGNGWRRFGVFLCPDCNTEHEMAMSNGIRAKSCLNCAKNKPTNKTHGQSSTRLYRIWCKMKERCYDPNHMNYHRYGGRGIYITPEWHDFVIFAEWAHDTGYNDIMTIDRVNNDGIYEPSNCQWLTREENSRKGGVL